MSGYCPDCGNTMCMCSWDKITYFTPTYGLTGEVDPTSENGQLFLATYILLQHKYKLDLNNAYSIMHWQLSNSFVDYGLYNRNPELKTRTMSNDNLTGIMSYSTVCLTRERFAIWEYLKRHFGTYDNTQGKSKQLSRFLPFNPANFFLWGLCAGSKLAYAFFPFFLINLVIACNKPVEHTSNKILYWVGMYPHKNHWLVKRAWAYYEKRMIAQYGELYIEALLERYHGGNSSEFPILKLIRENK